MSISAIGYDEHWLPSPDGHTRFRQVYRGQESIGRVCRWQEEDGSLTREWFGAERKAGAFYEPLEGRFATFEEALDRVVFYGVEG